MKDLKVLGMDLDGTLVKMKLDFKAIRKELDIPNGDTLKYITSLPRESSEKMLSLLRDKEVEAANIAELSPGGSEILSYCEENGIKTVVITRSSSEAANRTLEVLGIKVDMIISREHAPPKPSPEPINIVLNHFSLKPYQMAFVGDYLYDIQAGKAAGVRTILLTVQERSEEWRPIADFVVQDLYDVLELLKAGRARS
ncbi:MAG: HAD family hydrolase [Thermoplasmatota archaeon]